MRGTINTYNKTSQLNLGYHSLVESLLVLAKHFEDEVYLTGLKEIVAASQEQTLSSKFGGVGMNITVHPDGIHISLNDNRYNYTVVEKEGKHSHHLGYGINSLFPVAERLVNTVITQWKTKTLIQRKKMFT